MLTVILVRISYEELHSKVGQNVENKVELTSLGMSTKKEELVLPPTLLFFFFY
jgi:hypothetical protein